MSDDNTEEVTIRLNNDKQLAVILDQLFKNENNHLNQPVVSKSVLESLTGQFLNEDYVKQENEELTEKYGIFAEALGFDSFLELYQAASSGLESVAKGGDKDLSRLHRTTRTVTRNGKQMKTTVYEDPDEDSDEDANDEDKKKKDPKRRMSAKDINFSFQDSSKRSSEEVNAVQDYLESASGVSLESENNHYMVSSDEGNIQGAAQITENENYLILQAIKINDNLEDFELRVFYALLLKAWKKRKGIVINTKISDNPILDEEFKSFGFQEKNSKWQVEPEDLVEVLGEYQ